MFCQKCGRNILPTDRFCQFCGTPNANGRAPDPQQNQGYQSAGQPQQPQSNQQPAASYPSNNQWNQPYQQAPAYQPAAPNPPQGQWNQPAYASNQPLSNPIPATVKNKKLIMYGGIAGAVLLAIIIAVTVIAVSSTKYTDYNNVIEVVRDAFNKNDRSLLRKVVYSGLDDSWNNENIYGVYDDIFDDYAGKTLSISSVIEDFENVPTVEVISDIRDETGITLDIDEAIGVEMEGRPYLDIYMAKIHGRWYLIALE